MKKIIDETIEKLVEKKNSLNYDMDGVIYSDLEKVLVVEDICKIDKIRKEIKLCYDIVEYLDKISRGLKDE